MADRTIRQYWLARTSLLIALLAFVSGATLEPVVHSSFSAGELVSRPAVDRDLPNSGGSGQHDDTWCAVCHALGGLALPTLGATPDFNEPISVDLPAGASHAPNAMRIANEHARAPPI